MSIRTRLKSGVYQDSVRLMRLSEELSQLPGVRRATVAMGTDANRRTLAQSEMLTGPIAEGRADDLMIAVDATDDATAEAALTRAEEFLAQASRPGATAGVGRPPGGEPPLCVVGSGSRPLSVARWVRGPVVARPARRGGTAGVGVAEELAEVAVRAVKGVAVLPE